MTSDRPLPADPPARISPLSPDQFTDEMRCAFQRWAGGPFKDPEKARPLMTYARHPRLADLFSQFNMHLLVTSTLPVKQRQMAILRTAWLCDATYMWSSHLNTSLLFGLDSELFRPVQIGADDPYFTDFERTIIRATDDLVLNHEVGARNWELLTHEWNEQQILDFLFTVGAYVLTAGVMRSIGMERDENLLALAAKHGAPGQPTGVVP